jgi:hypothetical protein
MNAFDPKRPRVNGFEMIIEPLHGRAVCPIPWPTVRPTSFTVVELTVWVPSDRNASYRALTTGIPLDALGAFYAAFIADPERILRDDFKWDFHSPAGRLSSNVTINDEDLML